MPFPSTLHVRLPEFQRSALDFLRERHPHDCTDEELLRVVLSRGILAMMESQLVPAPVSLEEIAGNMQDADARMQELQARGVRPFPKPSVLYRQRQKALQEAVEEEANQQQADPAEVFNDLGQAEDGDVHAMPHRHVEQTLWVLMPEEMRQSFEDFLDAHPDLDENDALRLLLGCALDQEEQLGQTPEGKKVAGMLSLAERLCARSKRRCE